MPAEGLTFSQSPPLIVTTDAVQVWIPPPQLVNVIMNGAGFPFPGPEVKVTCDEEPIKQSCPTGGVCNVGCAGGGVLPALVGAFAVAVGVGPFAASVTTAFADA